LKIEIKLSKNGKKKTQYRRRIWYLKKLTAESIYFFYPFLEDKCM
jgi:hypothetical protein